MWSGLSTRFYSHEKTTVQDGKRAEDRYYQMQFVVQDWILVG